MLFGSFYNVVGLRVPKRESIVLPPSHCPDCGLRLAARDLIPVLSFLLLKGRCRFCGARLSLLYTFVELVTASLFTAAFLDVGWSRELILSWALISLLMIVSVSDFTYMIIPDKVLAVFAVLFVVLRLSFSHAGMGWQPFLGAAVGFAVPCLVAVVSGGNLGGGDIKLFAVLGLALGWEGVLMAFLLSTCYGALIGGIGIGTGKIKKRQPVPFVPFIAMGTLTAYFFGDALVKWYFHFL